MVASAAPVTTVALPFGRYDRRVLAKLASAGYRTVYSSDGMMRLSGQGVIPRFSVRSDLPLAKQIAWLEHRPGFARRLRQEAKLRLKALR